MNASWVPEGKSLYLFDVDGVLLKTSPHFSERYEAQKAAPGLTATFFAGVFQECLVGKADLKAELEKRLSAWQWEESVEELLALWFAGEAEIHREVHDTITSLRERGSACYLVTNEEKYRTAYLMDTLGIGTLADGVFASYMLGVKKPDTRFYHTVCTRIGYTGAMSDVFYADNDMRNITAAQNLGIDAFYYKA